MENEIKKEEVKENNKVETSNKLHAKDYRKRAINIIKPMRGDFAVVYFVYAIIVGAISGITYGIAQIGLSGTNPTYIGFFISFSLSGLFVLLTSGAFVFSFIHLAKEARKTSQKPRVAGLFHGFKDRYPQSLGVFIITFIFTVLWTLLLIIPGIIKGYAYSMSQYIAFDNPDKTTLECITESRKLMKGHKWKLFCLQISFIGWFILVILTLGILSFWVLPKYQQSVYEFYLHLINKD